MGFGAPILFPPSAGSLKYTLNAVASICDLSIAFIAAPPAFAALKMVSWYVPTWAHVAVADRSWKGRNVRSHVAEGHVPVFAWPVMMPWPFLLCQNPCVSAPVATQIVTVLLAGPPGVCVSSVTKVALLVNDWHTDPFDGTGTTRG